MLVITGAHKREIRELEGEDTETYHRRVISVLAERIAEAFMPKRVHKNGYTMARLLATEVLTNGFHGDYTEIEIDHRRDGTLDLTVRTRKGNNRLTNWHHPIAEKELGHQGTALIEAIAGKENYQVEETDSHFVAHVHFTHESIKAAC